MLRKALLVLLMLTAVMIPATACGKTETPAPTAEPAVTEPPYEEVALAASNVAREGYAVASSSKYDGDFSNLYLNDGDLSTGFSTQWGQGDDTSAPQYILIDLAGVKTVEAVKLYPFKGEEKGFPVDFDIMISTDNVNYTTVASVDGSSADQAKDGLTVSFDPADAEYVKLVTRKTGVGSGNKGAYISLAEFEVIASITTSSNMVLNRDDIWLYRNPDTTQQLNILYYRDGSEVDSNAKLTYTSEDPSIAAVDGNGLITPVAAGKTTVYVNDGKNRSACQVEVKEEPVNDFRITAFYHSTFGTPETYVKGLQIIKDSGVEYIEDTRFCDQVGNNITMYMIYLCNKLGLAYSVCDQQGGGGGYLSMTDEEIIAIVQKYENRAGLYGLYLFDEPHEEYTRYAEVHRLIQEYNPHLIPHLNLLPPFNFGGTAEYFTEYAAVAGGARRMQFLSFDYYPFRWGGSFESGFYGAINMVREAGVMYNADTGYYMQSMIISGAYPLLYEKELRYNASLGMAYGMKNYKWFVALTPINSGEAFVTGMVGPDFEPAKNYEDITATNKIIKNMGRYLANFDAVEVYHTNNEKNSTKVPDTFLLQPSNKKSAIYTLYRANDGSNLQRILVTNKNYAKTTAIEFAFYLTSSVSGLKLYDPLTDQETDIAVDSSNTFTFSLEPGACALILLPEGVDATSPAEQSDNLALGKGIFVSSSQAEFWSKGNIGTHFLTDGDTSKGYWVCSSDDKDCELLIDLGKVTAVGKVLFYGHFDLGDRFCHKFTVSVSEDGVNYTEVSSMTPETPKTTDTPCTCTFSQVNARYIRVQLLDNTGSGTGFGEIEVYAS